VVIVNYGLQNTAVSLVLAHSSFSIPFALWLLRGFFQSLPADLEEAAFIDGASHLQALRLIVIPLAMPGW